MFNIALSLCGSLFNVAQSGKSSIFRVNMKIYCHVYEKNETVERLDSIVMKHYLGK